MKKNLICRKITSSKLQIIFLHLIFKYNFEPKPREKQTHKEIRYGKQEPTAERRIGTLDNRTVRHRMKNNDVCDVLGCRTNCEMLAGPLQTEQT